MKNQIVQVKMVMMIKLLIVLVFFTNVACSQNYETFNELEFSNNLINDKNYLEDLKKKDISCLKKIKNHKDSVLELYDVCLRNDSLTVYIQDKQVYFGRTKGRKDNLGSQLLFKSTQPDTICFPLEVMFLYHDSNKTIHFEIPRESRRITVRGYLNNAESNNDVDRSEKVPDFVKITYSLFSYNQYKHLISCKQPRAPH